MTEQVGARAQRARHQTLEIQEVAGLKKIAARQRRIIVFIDESGLSERPCRARTWAPKGHTPMLPPEHPEVPLTTRMCPLGRIGTTDDVVGIYHFLASGESRYITGQAIAVDGGMLAGVSFGTLEAVAMMAEGVAS